MPKLPVISGAEAIEALRQIGFVVDRQRGSHVMMIRLQPAPATTITIPLHKPLKRGTLRAIIRDAGLEVEQFVQLLR